MRWACTPPRTSSSTLVHRSHPPFFFPHYKDWTCSSVVEYQPHMHEFLSLIPQDDKRKKNKQDFVKYVFFWYMVICESITAQVSVFHVV